MAVAETRLIIVCVAAVRDQINATLNQIDPTSVGDIVRVGLRLTGTAGTIPDAYWTSWAMTNDSRAAILKAWAQQGWRPLRGSEGTVLTTTDGVAAFGTQRFWMFDGQVGYGNVLTALGLETIPAEN